MGIPTLILSSKNWSLAVTTGLMDMYCEAPVVSCHHGGGGDIDHNKACNQSTATANKYGRDGDNDDDSGTWYRWHCG